MSNGFQTVSGSHPIYFGFRSPEGPPVRAVDENNTSLRTRSIRTGSRKVWLWKEWSKQQPAFGFDGADFGIDLVAKEREGGFCAIQCKCYAPGTHISQRTSG